MKTFIGANWKMHPRTMGEARDLARAIATPQNQDVEAAVFVPAVYLRELSDEFPHLLWGVQNVFYKSEGAYTGEISTSMARDAGASYVLVGHSERRRLFGETDEMVARRASAALSKGFNVVLAVGEMEKDADISAVVDSLIKSTTSIDKRDYNRLTVAYEPVWAISTSKNQEDATPDYVATIVGALKQELDVRYIYGGSVDSSNVQQFLEVEGVDGALVGSASLKADEFNAIIKTASSL